MLGPQRLDGLLGKIVRINGDGSIPKDNPFVGKAGFRPEIFSYGHRTPTGMTLNKATGEIWETEMGPNGGDEVNRVQRGGNYGWPVVTYGRAYPNDPEGKNSGLAPPNVQPPAQPRETMMESLMVAKPGTGSA